jgi:hypothetical protein
MYDAVGVRVADCFEYLSDDRYSSGRLDHSSFLDIIGEQSARNEFHDQIVRTVVFAKREQARQIWMIETRHRDSFLKEALLYYGIPSVLLVEFLDGHHAAGRVDILGPEDRSEPATADVIDNPIVSDKSAAHILSDLRHSNDRWQSCQWLLASRKESVNSQVILT